MAVSTNPDSNKTQLVEIAKTVGAILGVPLALFAVTNSVIAQPIASLFVAIIAAVLISVWVVLSGWANITQIITAWLALAVVVLAGFVIWPRTMTLEGRISDSAGDPVGNETVILFDLSNRVYETNTDAEGYYQFTQVPTGKYRLQVRDSEVEGQTKGILVRVVQQNLAIPGVLAVVTSTPASILPTDTPIPVSVPPTDTPAPPTDTPVREPPTDTPVPEPTDTPTPVPPTPTRQPPTPTSGLGVGSTKVREKDGMEMVYVPGGTFQMGSTDAEIDAALKQCEQDKGSGNCDRGWFERESPRHSVTLDGFWIDEAEVTNEQFARCVADDICSAPSELSSYTHDSYYGNSQYDDYPVIYVDWDDARSYCEWVGGRLPTEAEWEYAARGPDGTVYPWGNDPPNDTLLNYNQNVGDTREVGSYPDGASWVGALDMAGNVWEWVADWWRDYPSTAQTNPTGLETGDVKVLRGGSWRNYPYVMRSASRDRDYPVNRDINFGFRCVTPTDTPTPSRPIAPSNVSLHDTWTRPTDGMEMVYVPGGTFEMGSTDDEIDAVFERCEQDLGSGECERSWFERESPRHSVTLDSFWMDKTEVTNDQFEGFVQATDYRTDAEKGGTGWISRDGSWSEVDGVDWQHPNGPETSISDRTDHPVVQVSWNDARTYCQWAGGRLPTEAEWEYAARGQDGHAHPWGNDPPRDTLLNYYGNLGDTTQVGAYPRGASWVGAMDMAGNVWEWVADSYGEYPSEAQTNPKGPETGDGKVLRGGAWNNAGVYVRAAFRYHYSPAYCTARLGFRCVVEPGN
jgi:formylglycine-generating enzyme required for sulfatase activity